MAWQQDWRFCQKCHAMYFDGFPDKGHCAAGDGHSAAGYNFALPCNINATPTAQDAWRYCQKCHAIYYDGYQDKGHCPAGGGHSAAGFNFILPHDIPGTSTAQNAWRYCQKCHEMYYDGFPDKGHCAAGGGHAAAGFNFVLPHDIPSVLDFDFNPIALGNGVPVGGSAHLTIHQDGTFTFFGHYHDSGGLEYNIDLVVAVKDSQNLVYTFQHSGHVAGTFESGSRNDDFRIDSRDDRIANNWAFLAAGSSGNARTSVNSDFTNLTNTLIGTLGTVLGIVAIVIA